MMICKADFEELFPDLFQPETTTPRMAKPASAQCIARWEDDGGRTLRPERHGRIASGRMAQHGQDMSQFARAGAMAATMPIAAAYAAARVMFSAHGPTTTDRHETH